MVDTAEFFAAILANDHAHLNDLIQSGDYTASALSGQSTLGFKRTYTPVAWSARHATTVSANSSLLTLELLRNSGFSFSTGAPLLECVEANVSKYLVENGAIADQADAADFLERTPLACRIAENNLAVSNVILKEGADPNARLNSDQPLVFFALDSWARTGLPALEIGRCLALLSAFSLDFDIKDGDGNNIINYFLFPNAPTQFRDMESLIAALDEFLIHDVDVSSKNKYADTPLHQAVGYSELRKQPFSIISRLFSFGADLTINDFDLKGQTPVFSLMQPASYSGPLKDGDADLFDLLVARGADLALADNKGNTPLHLLCYHACPPPNTVSPNPPPKSGTPARKPYIRILKTLIAAGAPLGHKNSVGKTPKDIAQAADKYYKDFNNIVPTPKMAALAEGYEVLGKSMTAEVEMLFESAIRKYHVIKGTTSVSITFRSAWRSVQRQAELFEKYQYFLLFGGPKQNAADMPGDSTHNYGVALDVNIEGDPIDIRSALRAAGWDDPYPKEPWHFDAVTAKDYASAEAIRKSILPKSQEWAETLRAALTAEKKVKDLDLKLPVLTNKQEQASKKVKDAEDNLRMIEKKLNTSTKEVVQLEKKVAQQEAKVETAKSDWENVKFVCPNGYAFGNCDHEDLKKSYSSEKLAKEMTWTKAVGELQKIRQQLSKAEAEKTSLEKDLKKIQAELKKFEKAEQTAKEAVDDAKASATADKLLANKARLRMGNLLGEIDSEVAKGPS